MGIGWWIPGLRKGKGCGLLARRAEWLSQARKALRSSCGRDSGRLRAVPRRRRGPRARNPLGGIPACGKNSEAAAAAAPQGGGGGGPQPGRSPLITEPMAASRDMPPTRDSARPADPFQRSWCGAPRPRRPAGGAATSAEPLAVVPMPSAAGSAAFRCARLRPGERFDHLVDQSFTRTSEVFVGTARRRTLRCRTL